VERSSRSSAFAPLVPRLSRYILLNEHTIRLTDAAWVPRAFVARLRRTHSTHFIDVDRAENSTRADSRDHRACGNDIDSSNARCSSLHGVCSSNSDAECADCRFDEPSVFGAIRETDAT